MGRGKVTLRKVAMSIAVLGSALLLTSSVAAFSPALPSLIWSRDGEHIIFSTPFQGTFVVDAAGTRLQTIPQDAPLGTRRDPGNHSPALSPDGMRVAYVTHPYGDSTVGAIETAALDGTGVERLTVYKDRDGDGIDDNRNVAFPVWSPDGSRIAFLSGRQSGGSPNRLSIMDADGSNERVLVPSVDTPRDPSVPPQVWWAPDGRWLAFVGKEWPPRYILYTVQVDGSQLTKIGEIQWFGVAAWSPDSSRLAFYAPRNDELSGQHHTLYTVRPDGSGLTEVSRDFHAKSQGEFSQMFRRYGFGLRSPPAWSPDGAWLAFAKEDEEGFGVYVARPDGADLRLVVRGHGGPVSWSSDGTELYIADTVYAVRPDGTGLRSLLTEDILWPDELNFIAWSPDGSRLAVLTVSEDHTFTLFTLARDKTDRRVLAKGTTVRVVAQHSGWYDVPRNVAACAKGFVVPEPEANPGLVQDCETLLAARDILIADSYLNWSAADPITAWEGVEVGCPLQSRVVVFDAWAEIGTWCSSSLRVIGLRLTGLAGQIPSTLGKLDALRSLKLSYYDRDFLFQKLRPLPPEWKDLANLEELHIQAAGQIGSIPPQWGNLANLRVLRLRGEFPNGRSIPPQLGNLAKLKELHLSNTNLSGNIPPELGKLTNLGVLLLDRNNLSGHIPAELGKLANLESLVLYQNSLSGTIPTELGELVSLNALLLHQNKLTGPIPSELGNLARLTWLDLGSNELTGAIPPELGNLATLVSLDLSHNKLTGNIPLELESLVNLALLELAGNNLAGCVPRALVESPLRYQQSEGWAFCR